MGDEWLTENSRVELGLVGAAGGCAELSMAISDALGWLLPSAVGDTSDWFSAA
jgi:hypothetical protein